MKSRQEVRVAIKDESPGVEEHQLKDIFTLYYEGGKAGKEPVKDTGIGLALAKELVELHQGTIWAENALHIGLIVTIALPLGGKIKYNGMELRAELAGIDQGRLAEYFFRTDLSDEIMYLVNRNRQE